MQDELKKNLLLLKSFKKNLKGANLYGEQVGEYNGFLLTIENHGCDLKEFMVRPDELKVINLGSIAGRTKYSKPRILMPNFLKKLDAVLEYLDSVSPLSSPVDDVGVARVRKICDRFGEVALQLRDHRKDHTPLQLKDEYDVQYLLHALLKVDFDDVRPEEQTQSYAGSSTLADFVLPDIEVVIEVKYARTASDKKRLGNEIIIDIPHYETHTDCERMFVLIYDPKRVLKNPVGWKKDLEKREFKGKPIQVFVAS